MPKWHGYGECDDEGGRKNDKADEECGGIPASRWKRARERRLSRIVTTTEPPGADPKVRAVMLVPVAAPVWDRGTAVAMTFDISA
jgi:hypothetical protein